MRTQQENGRLDRHYEVNDLAMLSSDFPWTVDGTQVMVHGPVRANRGVRLRGSDLRLYFHVKPPELVFEQTIAEGATSAEVFVEEAPGRTRRVRLDLPADHAHGEEFTYDGILPPPPGYDLAGDITLRVRHFD